MLSNKLRLIFLSMVVFVSSCATKKITNTACWVNQEKKNNKYTNIYILGMLATNYNNIIVEGELASQAKQRGIETTRNYDVQPVTEVAAEMRKDLAIMKIKQYKCDAICTFGIKDIHAESRYVGGSSLSVSGYVPYGSYGGYYNQFPTYYSNYYNNTAPGGYYSSGTVELNKGHVETDKTYFVECNLFDAASYELLFSIQSEAFNPQNIEKVSKEYCDAIFKTLEKEGVIKQKAVK